jgi:hypothetical protein
MTDNLFMFQFQMKEANRTENPALPKVRTWEMAKEAWRMLIPGPPSFFFQMNGQ